MMSYRYRIVEIGRSQGFSAAKLADLDEEVRYHIHHGSAYRHELYDSHTHKRMPLPAALEIIDRVLNRSRPNVDLAGMS